MGTRFLEECKGQINTPESKKKKKEKRERDKNKYLMNMLLSVGSEANGLMKKYLKAIFSHTDLFI